MQFILFVLKSWSPVFCLKLRLILEFCDGGSLAEVLERGGFFDGESWVVEAVTADKVWNKVLDGNSRD